MLVSKNLLVQTSKEEHMNNLMNFDFNGTTVTTIIDEKGDPWWVAKEVCGVLGIREAHDTVKYLDEDEQTRINNPGLTSSRNPNVLIVNESGLYSLILRSRKPEAKVFKKWVTSEVLPAIRKTGGYRIPAPAKEMTETDIMSKALLIANRNVGELEKVIGEQMTIIKAAKPKLLEYEAAKPKIVEFDKFMDSKGYINFTQLSKIYTSAHRERLLQICRDSGLSHLSIGRKKLLEFLKHKKVIQRSYGNPPYQNYMDKHWFYVHSTLEGFPQTKVTPQGQINILKYDPIEILDVWRKKMAFLKLFGS